MLGFTSLTSSLFPKFVPILHHNNYNPLLKLKTQKVPSRFILSAQNPKKNNLKTSEKDKKQGDQQQPNGSINGDDSKEDRRSLFNLKWGEIFDPDPDNIFAVGLTGVLTWASVQVLWQLLVISSAILVAALKYSFIAALLIVILITLL
ncbi:uncharacterized protein LOC123205992 [Mangifera indica]|uniref:uncharacterized protein LOC123205992 n=1 Tax=Mangifera indica TaxID=29780 RepID=UPI001CFA86A2|nr:uncharacterized protein LOC123205992 [Mangifera indica]